MGGIAIFFGINYFTRLFSIPFLGIFQVYPDSWRLMTVGEAMLLKALTWLEFGLISALILIIALLCLIFAYVCETVKFLIGGRPIMTMNAANF